MRQSPVKPWLMGLKSFLETPDDLPQTHLELLSDEDSDEELTFTSKPLRVESIEEDLPEELQEDDTNLKDEIPKTVDLETFAKSITTSGSSPLSFGTGTILLDESTQTDLFHELVDVSELNRKHQTVVSELGRQHQSQLDQMTESTRLTVSNLQNNLMNAEEASRAVRLEYETFKAQQVQKAPVPKDQKPLISDESRQLREYIEQIDMDYESLYANLEDEKRKNARHEADFKLFSKKLLTQHERIRQNDELRVELRRMQFEMTDYVPEESVYKTQVETLTVDIKALKLLCRELKADNDALRSSSNYQEEEYQPRHTSARSNRWAQVVPPRSEFQRKDDPPFREPKATLLDRLRMYEREEDPIERTPSPKRNEFVVHQAADGPIETFMAQRSLLDDELNRLQIEKQQLQFELSRVPSSGGKHLSKMTELEDKLDSVDHQMAGTRRKMRGLGIL